MLTLTEAAEQIRARRLSPAELTAQYLAQIERLNSRLNAFITVTSEAALEQARQAEAELRAGKWRGPLHGIPIALKDLFDMASVPATAASNQFRNRVAGGDSEMVQLLKQAGAVILGKLNLHEFAFGVSGIVSAFGPVRNPWDMERITGGSSSGSAAAVAAGLCVAAIGTDTAGSVRCPSSLCGITGLRPSADVLGGCGAIPLASSFDTAGPMTRTVRDAALLLDALVAVRTGSRLAPVYAAGLNENVSKLKIGIARKGFFDDLEPGVALCVEQAIEVVNRLTASTSEVQLVAGSHRTIFNAEIYEFHESMVTTHPELYDPRTLVRVQSCAGISATDYIRDWREVQEERVKAEELFEQIDLVLTPTVPIVAPKLSQLELLPTAELRPFESKRLMHNTAGFSSLYWPSVSVPCGFTQEGLPVGLQVSGKPGTDAMVLRLAHAYEQSTEWHKRVPEMAES